MKVRHDAIMGGLWTCHLNTRYKRDHDHDFLTQSRDGAGPRTQVLCMSGPMSY